jgi:hypothetical protein
VTLFGEVTRSRVEQLKGCFLAHGATDPVQARHEAVVAVAGRIDAGGRAAARRPSMAPL